MNSATVTSVTELLYGKSWRGYGRSAVTFFPPTFIKWIIVFCPFIQSLSAVWFAEQVAPMKLHRCHQSIWLSSCFHYLLAPHHFKWIRMTGLRGDLHGWSFWPFNFHVWFERHVHSGAVSCCLEMSVEAHAPALEWVIVSRQHSLNTSQN